MTDYDAIVAGAGIWGCTVARRLAEAGKRVLVLEKRPVVGGNIRCETDSETGIEIHTYGSHIFHTHIPEVWEFVNRFVTFNGYQHKVLARTRALPTDADERLRSKVEVEGGRTYHLPLGLTLINKFFDVELRPTEVAAFLDEQIPSSTSTSNLPPRRQAIFDAFFRGYTCKQWGKSPEEIDPSIIKRVPVRSNYDTNYFNDYNQGIPLTGYNSLFERILDHPNIAVETEMALTMVGADLRAARNPNSTQSALEIDCGRPGRPPLPVYYSGPIDALFDYKFGALPWRTLNFERETLDCPDYQGTSVVNYTDIDVPYTRIHEFKHYHPEGKGRGQRLEVRGQTKDANLHSTPTPTPTTYTLSTDWGFDAPKTVIMREYSATWKLGDEPYYPIDTPDSRALLVKYQEEVVRLNQQFKQSNNPNNQTILTVGGRLGGYKYYDMDKSIEAALKVAID